MSVGQTSFSTRVKRVLFFLSLALTTQIVSSSLASADTSRIWNPSRDCSERSAIATYYELKASHGRWRLWGNPDTTPGYIDDAIDFLEHSNIWHQYQSLLNLEPRAVDFVVAPTDLIADDTDGVTTAACNQPGSVIYLDLRSAADHEVGDSETLVSGEIKQLVAHELFHAFQAAATPHLIDTWWVEATAEWAAKLRYARRPFSSFFLTELWLWRHPELPFDSFDPQMGSKTLPFQYAQARFVQALAVMFRGHEHEFGQFLAATFRRAPQPNESSAVDNQEATAVVENELRAFSGLLGQRAELSYAYADFASWHLFGADPTALGNYHERWYAWSNQEIPAESHVADVPLGDGDSVPVNAPALATNSAGGEIAPVVFTLSNHSVRKIEFTFSNPPPGLRLWVQSTTGAAAETSGPYSQLLNGAFLGASADVTENISPDYRLTFCVGPGTWPSTYDWPSDGVRMLIANTNASTAIDRVRFTVYVRTSNDICDPTAPFSSIVSDEDEKRRDPDSFYARRRDASLGSPSLPERPTPRAETPLPRVPTDIVNPRRLPTTFGLPARCVRQYRRERRIPRARDRRLERCLRRARRST